MSNNVAVLRLLVVVNGDLATLDAVWGDRWASFRVRRLAQRGLVYGLPHTGAVGKRGCRATTYQLTGAGWAMLAADDKITKENHGSP